MPKYLVTVYHPNEYDASISEDAAMDRAIDLLNEEMVAASIRIFVGGLHSPDSARSVRTQSNGNVIVTDGSYLKTGEHVCGLWILEAADMEKALAWGKKASIACRAPIEVRQFH